MPTTTDSNEHILRRQFTLKLGALVLAAVSLFWGGYFIAQDNWTILPMTVVLIFSAILTEGLIRRAKMRVAAFMIYICAFAGVIVFCVFIDLPTGDTPRATHNYFLVLGVFAWIVFRDEKTWIRYAMTLFSLSAFSFFASHSWGLHTIFALDHHERVMSVWIHNFTVMVLLVILLWITQTNMRLGDIVTSELKVAISERQFVLFYQPQIGDGGRIVGAEALLRWMHPKKGMISPAAFMPLAERSGLILDIGQWVLDTACAQLVTWSKDPGTADLRVAVNVSALQFKQSDYVEKVLSSLKKSRANPALLTLELTESLLVNDVNDLIKKMEALRAKGIKLSLDDFGTGYSSLNYLKTLPLDQLKIDQSFVRDMLTDDSDMAIVRTIIELAKRLNLHVIAEGVETETQRQFLASVGCNAFQGYLLSKPVPIADFDRYAAAFKISASSSGEE